MFTNQCHMSAVTVCPRWYKDNFPLLWLIKSHYAVAIALGTVGISSSEHMEESLVISRTIDYFVELLKHSNVSVPDHRSLFSKLCLCDIINCYCIQMTYLTSPKTTLKAPLSCEHVVHVTSWNSVWHEASTLAPHNTRVRMWLWKFSMSGWHSPSLAGRCKWCKFLSCSTPMLFWCVGNPFARPITPSHQHYSFMLPALFSFLGESSWDT